MLAVNNVTMRFGPRVLFENVTCTFMAGRRYAITGPNGAGTSTFLKISTGGHRRRGGRLYGGSRCGGAARWLGRGRRTARTQDGRIAGRTESSRAVGTSALWKSDRAAAGRADEQPGPRFRTLAAAVSLRI